MERQAGELDAKRRIWESAIPEDFSLEIESLVDKRRVAAELVADGGIQFFRDLGSAYSDMKKGFWEWRSLLTDPIYKGEGYPHGGRKKVLVTGGMGSVNALHYWDLKKSLRALNHDAEIFPWTANWERPREQGRRLLGWARENVRGTGRKAAAVGHSLGTFQWLAAFRESPEEFLEYIDGFYSVESPIPGKLNMALKAASLFVNLQRDDIDILESLGPFHQLEMSGDISVTAVESSDDPMIKGMTIAGRESDHYIVEGSSHICGGVNPDLVKLIAYRLVGEEVDFNRVPMVHHAPVSLSVA